MTLMRANPLLGPLIEGGPENSVADPGCLSQIPDPEFYPSWIPATKERGEKNQLCSHKFHKIVNYFSFEVLKKKIWANFQRIIELFTKKIVNKLLKIWSWDLGPGIRDPGSGKNLFRIPDPGVKNAPDPGSGSATQPENRLFWAQMALASLVAI